MENCLRVSLQYPGWNSGDSIKNLLNPMSVQEIHVVQYIWLLENSMAVIMGPDMSFSYKQ